MYDYLAEILARSVVLSALQTPRNFHMFKSRNTLEAAWANGAYP